MFPQIFRTVFAIAALLIAHPSFAADVELKASWTKGAQHWLIHIQIDRPGFFIAPNSPAFDNDQLMQVTDAETRQPIPVRIRHERQRMMRSIDLAFPELRRPVNVFVSVGGLSIVDQKGRRVDYQQRVAVRAPASGDRRTQPSLRRRESNYSTDTPPPAPPPAPSPGHAYHHRTLMGSPQPQPSVAASTKPLVAARPPEDLGPPTEVGEAPPPEPEIPQFPFPPPQASASDTIPRDMLIAGKTRPKLKDVDAVLSAVFARCGYGEKSFYAVPDGFAMASRIEQINPDGSFGANRWSIATAAMSSFSLESYLRALFQARAGHFRVVVFIVTNHPFQQTDVKVSSEEAKTWVKKGLNELPKKIGDRDLTDDYVCTALIYEFKTLGGGEAIFVEPSEITGHTHLEKAGLLSALARPR